MSDDVISFPIVDALRPDENPPQNFEYACEVCGKELVYSGKGRHPKFCDDHKNGKSGGTKSRVNNIGKNEQLAAQAVHALMQLHGLGKIGLGFAKMPLTIEAMKLAEDELREQLFDALKTDPELCKTILKGGVQSGRIALIIAYGMFASVVAPMAVMEIKAKRERAAENEDRATVAGATNTA